MDLEKSPPIYPLPGKPPQYRRTHYLEPWATHSTLNVIKDGTHVFIVQKRPTAQKFARFMDSKRAKSLSVRPSNWPDFGQLRWESVL